MLSCRDSDTTSVWRNLCVHCTCIYMYRARQIYTPRTTFSFVNENTALGTCTCSFCIIALWFSCVSQSITVKEGLQAGTSFFYATCNMYIALLCLRTCTHVYHIYVPLFIGCRTQELRRQCRHSGLQTVSVMSRWCILIMNHAC